MQPTVLFIHMPKDRLMRLSMLALSLGIQAKEILENDWGQPLSALCGQTAPVKNPKKAAVDEEMMVMAYFTDALMDSFLRGIRQSGISPVRLKAVLTPYNGLWNLGQLYRSLSLEAAQMESGATRK